MWPFDGDEASRELAERFRARVPQRGYRLAVLCYVGEALQKIRSEQSGWVPIVAMIVAVFVWISTLLV